MQQRESTRKSGRTVKKTLGAFLCFLVAAWMLATPASLQAESPFWCFGYCVGACENLGASCIDSEFSGTGPGNFSCVAHCG